MFASLSNVFLLSKPIKLRMLSELQHHCHVFYTSGRRDSTGAWVWGATGQPFTYTAWGPGQPDNYMDGQDTCSIYDWNGPNRHLLWDDVDDDERVCFMCEFP